MTSSILKRALALHKAGRLKEAAAACRRALTAEPDNPDALHFLGLIAHQSGQHDDAVHLIQRAIARRSNPTYWYNIGHVHLARNDLPVAQDAFRQAIALAPKHAQALFHLGMLQSRSGDPTGAIECFKRATEAEPGFVDAHVNIGLLLNKTGDTAGAIDHLEEARRLRPGDAEIYNCLGTVRRSVASKEAIRDFRQALALNPDHADARTNLGKLLASENRHAEAVDILEPAVERRPEDSELRVSLAIALAELNRFDDAVRHFEIAIAAQPHPLRPLLSLGNLCLRFGRFEDAYRHYVRVRELEPDNCDALVGILKHLKSRVPDEEVRRVTRLAEDASRPICERRQLHFVLAACMEAKGDCDAAFSHMDRGNKLRRMELEPQNGPFDLAKLIARVDRIIEVFDESYFRRVAGFGVASQLPVFVIGMPRSGTTLCEQILASHSMVHGAGELSDMSAIERKLIRQYSERAVTGNHASYAAHLTSEFARSVGEKHLRHLQSLAPHASRIVDKLPLNFRRLGLIATLFPKATIIHCRRDPMDTGLSCYSKDFTDVPLWANDLESIGRMYRQYDRLMAHWSQVLPITVLDIQYEDTVRDLETSARRLIGHCSLEWEDACLEFYRTDRQIKTASFEQVRRPVYDASIGRWRKFERYLAPLRDALDEA